jgi:hypothetical protein
LQQKRSALSLSQRIAENLADGSVHLVAVIVWDTMEDDDMAELDAGL